LDYFGEIKKSHGDVLFGTLGVAMCQTKRPRGLCRRFIDTGEPSPCVRVSSVSIWGHTRLYAGKFSLGLLTHQYIRDKV